MTSEELTEKQIEKIRRDVAKAYHDLMIDLALKGEGRVGNRRFWRDADNVIRWEDLPDEEAAVEQPAVEKQTTSRARRNRRAAIIQNTPRNEGS